MTLPRYPSATRAPRLITAVLAFAVLAIASGCTDTSTKAGALPANASDPRAATAFVLPADLAATVSGAGEKPLLLHVGFQVLFRAGAIPGSRYAGPGSTPEGLASLDAAVKDVPHDRAVVIYCGCCPWEHCPNMGPAYQRLIGMGFTNVRALYTPKNLETDWVNKGYPLEKPAR